MRNAAFSRLLCGALALWPLLAWPQVSTNQPRRDLRVALISDLHVTRGTKDEQSFFNDRVERTIAAINAEVVDLVLVAGDLTENGKRAEFADFRRLIQKLHAPIGYVPGNHDIGGKVVPGKPGPKDVTTARVETYEWLLGPSWFAREYDGVRVVGINASLFGSRLALEGKMWGFLEKELTVRSELPTVLVMHYPPYTKKPNEPGGVYWNIEPKPRQRLLELARSSGVRAILSGHTHAEDVRRLDGILYVTTPPIAHAARGRQYRGWTLLTIPRQGDMQYEFRYQVD